MHDTCPECGASIPENGVCRDNFHALLLLEWQIPDGPGMLSHFYAVASYGLQHPNSMNYTAVTLANLYTNLTDVLQGHATLAEIRQRTRRATNGPVRITRRDDDASVVWPHGDWSMTVADVLTVPANADAYAARVLQWARAVCATLAAATSEN